MKKRMCLWALPLVLLACKEPAPKPLTDLPLNDSSLVTRGKYLVSIAGCNDCHSPKMMTAQGPMPDTTRLLSGHPADMPLAPYDSTTTKNWVLFNMMQTAVKGPWGVSYAANLTPDETGIGNWSEQHFSNAVRKGFFRGIEGGRHLLPPMPWQTYSAMNDEDLHAIFAYLKSLKPVKNMVPAAVPPGA